MAARILRAIVIVKDSDEDEKMEVGIATRRGRGRKTKCQAEMCPGVSALRLSFHTRPATSRCSIQDHHIARQTPQALVKTICSTRLLDSSLSVSAVGGLIKGDEHSRLGQSTPRVPQTAPLIGCRLERTITCVLFWEVLSKLPTQAVWQNSPP